MCFSLFLSVTVCWCLIYVDTKTEIHCEWMRGMSGRCRSLWWWNQKSWQGTCVFLDSRVIVHLCHKLTSHKWELLLRPFAHISKLSNLYRSLPFFHVSNFLSPSRSSYILSYVNNREIGDWVWGTPLLWNTLFHDSDQRMKRHLNLYSTSSPPLCWRFQVRIGADDDSAKFATAISSLVAEANGGKHQSLHSLVSWDMKQLEPTSFIQENIGIFM